MAISLKTSKMLWGRSASRCSFPSCKKELVYDESETDDACLIGEECHIVARSPYGPRGNSDLDPERRDKYANLILLCHDHHKLVDEQENTFTVDKLKEMKVGHENWVVEKLKSYDAKKQQDDEHYASIIENLCEMIHIDEWKDWATCIFLPGQQCIYFEINDDLGKFPEWIISRVWPRRYPELEKSIFNFSKILQDFINLFHDHSEKDDRRYYTKKFYHIQEWNKDRYDRLFKEYEYHCDLVADLMLELTRAVNYICDMVRFYIFNSFRLKEGYCLVTIPAVFDGKKMYDKTINLLYSESEKGHLYPGLEEFKKIRNDRDYAFGNKED